MTAKQTLTIKEKLYCHWKALGLSAEEAACRVDYSAAESAAAEEALRTPAGMEYAAAVQTAAAGRTLPTARDGYYRLAFGDVSEALALVLHDGESLCPQAPDLFNVSEIRRGKNGIELRFFDRMDALDRLSQLESAAKGDENSVYAAIWRSAETLSDTASDRKEPSLD